MGLKELAKKIFLVKPKRVINKLRSRNGSARVRVGDKTFERMETDKEVQEIVETEGIPTVEYDVPDDVGHIDFADGISEDEEIAMILSIQEADKKSYEDPNDEEMDYIYEKNDKKPHKQYTTGKAGGYGFTSSKDRIAHPDAWERAYYPAGQPAEGGQWGKKPDIGRIKQWVEDVKWAGMDDVELKEEWMGLKKRSADSKKESGSRAFKKTAFTTKQRENLLDSEAYMVARKIWYVGRKPSSMSDWEWNEHTRGMRPPEGSFGENDVFGDFPYGKTYVYKSGKWE